MMVGHLTWIQRGQLLSLLSLAFGKHNALVPARILANLVRQELARNSLGPNKLKHFALQILLILADSLLDLKRL